MLSAKREPILVLFDGECNLCNGVVQFLIRNDPSAERFRFAAQQSATGQSLLKKAGFDVNGETADTMLAFTKNRLFTHSDAALEIARSLPAPYSLVYVGKILPRFLRDALYRFVAKNRYKWFGKRDQCMMPTPELKARFLS